MAGPVIAAVVGMIMLLNVLAYGWMVVLKKINASGGETYVALLIAAAGLSMIIWAIYLFDNRNKNKKDE